MIYFLVWIEWLAIALLVTALGVSLFYRLKRRMISLLLSIGLALIIGCIFALFSALAWYFNTLDVRPSWLLGYCCSLFITYLMGVTYLLYRAHVMKSDVSGALLWGRSRLVLILLVVMGINIVTFFWNEKYLENIQEERFESLKASTSIYLRPPSDPAQNAAPLYKKVAEQLENADYDFLREVSDPDFDASSSKAASFLSKHQETLELLHQAAALPRWHFQFEIENLIDLDDIGLTNFINAACLLIMEARHYAKRGEADKAIESLSAVRKMAMHIYRYPGSLLNTAIASLFERRALRGLENVLYDISDREVVNMPILLMVEEPEAEDILRAMSMEDFFVTGSSVKSNHSLLGHIMFCELFEREESSLYWYEIPLEWVIGRLYNMFFSISDWKHHIHSINKLKTYVRYNCLEAMVKAKDLEEKCDNGVTDVVGLGRLGLFSDFFKYTCLIRACRRIEISALAAWAYYKDKGRCPASLEELAPQYLAEIPSDPFSPDGRQLNLKAREKGIVIYSVGSNQTDDGGKPGVKASEGDDIVFTLGDKPVKEKSVCD
ncbi:hypothetical protein ACFL2O_00260 [Thermodesulfobacteriota bacterium]